MPITAYDRLPNGVAERAILAALKVQSPLSTKALCRAVSARARRKVHEVTVAQALNRMMVENKIEKVAHGLYIAYSPHITRLSRVCMPKPIWRAIARVFDGKGDPFMRLDDILAKLRVFPPDDVLRELKALARKDVLEIGQYEKWGGAGKEGKGVGLTMRYWRPDQLPTIEKPRVPETDAELAALLS